ncbi:hypothetical protein EDD17DRAFT_1659720 [Pisolithus thermaeus]|nr:hypothetical protein EDD17DRAFT_1659720 [Pisolithus thermaeus]
MSLLLKDLSTRLAGKHLVTAVIQCSDFYTVDNNGNRRDSGGDNYVANTRILLQQFQNRMEKVTAIKFFEGLFGLKFLRNYIGTITFLEKFPYVMQTSTTSDVLSVGTAEAHPPKLSSMMRCNLFRVGRQITTAEPEPGSEIVLPLLHRRCQVLEGCEWKARSSLSGKLWVLT